MKLSFSKSQIGKELFLFPYVDYYSLDVPKIILKYNNKYDVLNKRIEERLDVRNTYDHSLFYVNSEDINKPHYTIINSSDTNFYEEPWEIESSSGYRELYNGKEIPLSFSKKSDALFGWEKFAFPFESYEIDDSRTMTVNFESEQPLSFFVKYQLEIKKMENYEINQKESYYCISPTKVETPLIISGDWTALYYPTIFDVREAGFVCQNSGQFLIAVNDKITYYSTAFNAEKNVMSNESEDWFSFDESKFVINIPHNEITINYHIKYSTKTQYCWYFLGLIILSIITTLGALVSIEKKHKFWIIVFISAIFGVLFTIITMHPTGYPITLFDIVPILSMIFVTGLYLFRRKISIKRIQKLMQSKNDKKNRRKKK